MREYDKAKAILNGRLAGRTHKGIYFPKGGFEPSPYMYTDMELALDRRVLYWATLKFEHMGCRCLLTAKMYYSAEVIDGGVLHRIDYCLVSGWRMMPGDDCEYTKLFSLPGVDGVLSEINLKTLLDKTSVYMVDMKNSVINQFGEIANG